MALCTLMLSNVLCLSHRSRHWVIDLDIDNFFSFNFSQTTFDDLSCSFCASFFWCSNYASIALFGIISYVTELCKYFRSHSISYSVWVIVIDLPSSLLILFCDIQFTEKSISEFFILEIHFSVTEFLGFSIVNLWDSIFTCSHLTLEVQLSGALNS